MASYGNVRAKRLPTEFQLIERREDIKNFKIQRYDSRLGLIINVQIPIADVVTTLTTEADYDWVFNKDKEDPENDELKNTVWPNWFINTPEMQEDQAAANRHASNVTHHDRHFEFEILLDHQYPFSPPQVFAVTRFTQVIDLYDNRDLHCEVLSGEEWKVGRNIHEIIAQLPDFIDQVKHQED